MSVALKYNSLQPHIKYNKSRLLLNDSYIKHGKDHLSLYPYLTSDPKNSLIHTTGSLHLDTQTNTRDNTSHMYPVTSLIPAVWFTEPPVSGTTQVYSPVGDV